MLDMKEIVKHFLKCYPDTRQNDTLLIMKICERKGFCKKLRTHRGDGYVFTEKTINSGDIPPSLFETIRRTRQKLQQIDSSLRPPIEVYEARQASQQRYKDKFANRSLQV